MAFNLGDALKDVSKLDTGREQIEYIRLDLLDENPNNFYQLSDIDKLAENIEFCGLQQPIRIRPIPGTSRYMIVSGHRRRKAIEILAKDDPEKWSEVSCIIERDEASPALQQLRLIYANASTRKMTSAEVLAQAEQIKKLLYQLKEEGYEFPGRMRDHVAEIVQISKSKLARLEVIRKGLAAAWQPAWKAGELVENTAYELAKMPKACQSLLFEEKTRTHANLNFLYADDVKKFAERCNDIVKMQCKDFGGDCSNYENKMRKAAVADRYYGCRCGDVCCRDCPELVRCQRACPRLAETIKKLKADAKEAAKQEKLVQEEKDRLAVEQISALWQRFGLCRELAFKDIDDCKAAMNLHFFPFDEEKTMKLECGEAKIEPTTKLPYGYSVDLTEVKRIIDLADLFGVSLDYLLCRSDVKELTSDAVPESDASEAQPQFIPGAWYPVTVEPPVGERLILIDSEWFVDSGKYIGCGEYSMDYGAPVMYWTLEPKPGADMSAAMPAVTGWRSGTPEAYGTYVAYVQMHGVNQASLRELLWDGEEWFMFGEKISELATVRCWMERPDF